MQKMKVTITTPNQNEKVRKLHENNPSQTHTNMGLAWVVLTHGFGRYNPPQSLFLMHQNLILYSKLKISGKRLII
jgi:hypothetical protein